MPIGFGTILKKKTTFCDLHFLGAQIHRYFLQFCTKFIISPPEKKERQLILEETKNLSEKEKAFRLGFDCLFGLLW